MKLGLFKHLSPLLLALPLAFVSSEAWAIKCADLLDTTTKRFEVAPATSRPWDRAASAKEARGQFKSFVDESLAHDPSALVEQNREFLRKITTPDGKTILPEHYGKISQADLEYLNQNPRAVGRATDPDRVSIWDNKANKANPRTIDAGSIEEARAMEIAEKTGALPSPVERSFIKGADVSAGSGATRRDYSMKSIVGEYPGTKKPPSEVLVESIGRAKSEASSLLDQPLDPAQSLRHLCIDLRRLDPSKVKQVMQEVSEIVRVGNLERPASSQLDLRFILNP